MRFASIGGSNAASYAAAGKAVADSGAKMFKKQRETGPDYAGLSQVAMQTASNEKIAGMKAEAKVTNIGINQYSRNTRIANNIKADEKIRDIKNSQRKAGGLAAIGKIAGAGFLASRDNTKGRERPKGNLSEINSKHQAAQKALMAKHDAESANLKPPSNSAFASKTSGESGKVAAGDDLSPSTNTTSASEGWRRMSNVIKLGEGTQGSKGYTTMFTGKQFTDTSKHPELINRSGRHASDAAGAYQFLSTTWKPAAAKLGITDFSPESQEKVGKYLAQQRGMNTDVVHTTKASLGKALNKIAPEWASMPTLATGTSYYGQGGINLDEAWAEYNR